MSFELQIIIHEYIIQFIALDEGERSPNLAGRKIRDLL